MRTTIHVNTRERERQDARSDNFALLVPTIQFTNPNGRTQPDGAGTKKPNLKTIEVETLVFSRLGALKLPRRIGG
jgi:hypothetical protein